MPLLASRSDGGMPPSGFPVQQGTSVIVCKKSRYLASDMFAAFQIIYSPSVRSHSISVL